MPSRNRGHTTIDRRTCDTERTVGNGDCCGQLSMGLRVINNDAKTARGVEQAASAAPTGNNWSQEHQRNEQSLHLTPVRQGIRIANVTSDFFNGAPMAAKTRIVEVLSP